MSGARLTPLEGGGIQLAPENACRLHLSCHARAAVEGILKEWSAAHKASCQESGILREVHPAHPSSKPLLVAWRLQAARTRNRSGPWAASFQAEFPVRDGVDQFLLDAVIVEADRPTAAF